MTTHRTWPRRLLRYFLWSGFTLITLYALLCAWLNWSGARARERVKARFVTAGETLDFQSLLPTPIAPAKNFFDIDLLRDISKIEDRDAAKGEPAEKRKKLERMKMESTSRTPVPSNGVQLGTPVDMSAISQWLKNVKAISPPEKPELSAQDIRQMLETAFPELLQLAGAVSTRTEAEFVPSLAQRPRPVNLFELTLPQYTSLMSASRPLQWHGFACADMGQGDAALRDAQVLLRFSEAGQREPMLISLLVAMVQQSTAHELLWHVLLHRNAGEEALRGMQADLGTSWEGPTLCAFRGEMAAAASAVQVLEHATGEERRRLLTYVNSDVTGNPGILGNTLFGMLPDGFFAISGAHLVQSEFDMFILPLKNGGLRALLAKSSANEESLKQIKNHWITRWDGIMTSLILPSISGVALKAAAVEVRRRQALAACALERWFIKNQAYPDALEKLVPEFLKEVPVDLIDGKPMRYRQTAEGRYVLWSVGFDGKDDGGQVTLNTNAIAPTANMYKETYQGDWAWQYEPVK